MILAIPFYRANNGFGLPEKVLLQTTSGGIFIRLHPGKMPVTVKNFIRLVNSNFYDNLKFHRVEDWVVQGGDPRGDGTGGPGWSIPLETSSDLTNIRGAVAMARDKNPDSAGSQFYVLKKDMPALDGKYAVFGEVVQGMYVVDQIRAGDKIQFIKVV